MKLLLVIMFGLGSTISIAQLKIYKFEQVDSLQDYQKRPVVVFIHTDWCRYCKMMETSTFKSDSIISKLNKDFYFVSFNPEEKKTVRFAGRTFNYKPATGINELAERLGEKDGKISYPTLCILNRSYEIVLQYNQFMSTKNLIRVLNLIDK